MYIKFDGTQALQSGPTNNWTISGLAGGTRLGTSHNDVFNSIAGDTLVGGAGDDIYNLWDAASTVVEKAGGGIDTINVDYWGGIKLPDQVENVNLISTGANWATGNALDNIIVAGTTGATLDGGAGNDVLVGGAGDDVFKIEAGNGSDAIVNFRPGWDVVELNGYGITNFGQIKSMASQVGADVVVKLSATESVVIRGVQLSSLSAADFDLPAATSSAPQAVAPGEHVLSGPAAWNANGWYVNNNAWGVGSMVSGKDYTLNSSFNTSNMTQGTTFNWSFPLVTNVTPSIVAFPEVIFGSSPLNTSGTDTTDTAHVFPARLSDIVGLTAKYDVSFGGNVGGFDVAYDIWLSNSPTAVGKAAVSNEVMIWVHKGSFQPSGTIVGTYTKGDFTATIYHTGTYTAVVADHDVPAGTIDIADIMATLKGLGIISDSEYLRSVELGAEVVSGTGSLTINDLDLNVVTSDGHGGTIAKTVTGAGTTEVDTPAPVPAAVKLPATGTTTIYDAHGYAIGKAITTLNASGTETITKVDNAGRSLGHDVVSVTATKMTTLHYSGAGALMGQDQAITAADGSVSTQHYDALFQLVSAERVFSDTSGNVYTQHYDASWNLTGVDKAITAPDGSVTVQHYNAAWVLTGADRTVTVGTTVTTFHYDGSCALTGSDKVIHAADGSTAIQHFNAAFALTSEDLIKVANGTTTTYHYDGVFHLLGVDIATTGASGVVTTLNYDGNFKLLSTTLTGTDGADTLAGSSGTTHFHGGLGSDTLKGGSGVDYFHFDTAIGQGDVDTITGFGVAKDKIVLDQSIFSQLSKAGALDPSMFVVGTKALTANQHVIYDSAHGNLYYDADGSGSHAPVLLAHITADATLTAGNFLVS